MPKFKRFIDLDLNFIKHPISNDVSRKYDTEAVIKSVRQLILTNFYDRPFHPEIGTNIRAMLFENDSLFTRGLIRDAIKNIVEAYEPRVTDLEVIVEKSSDDLTYNVVIILKIVGIIEPVTLNITLERVR